MPDTKGNLLKQLSARERQLFDLMVEGRSLAQIAALMGVFDSPGVFLAWANRKAVPHDAR